MYKHVREHIQACAGTYTSMCGNMYKHMREHIQACAGICTSMCGNMHKHVREPHKLNNHPYKRTVLDMNFGHYNKKMENISMLRNRHRHNPANAYWQKDREKIDCFYNIMYVLSVN